MTWRGDKVTTKKKTNWQQTDGSLEQRYRKCKLTHTKQLQGDTKLLRDIKRLQRHSKGSKKPSEQTSKQPEADTEQPEKTPSLQRCSLKWQRHTDEQKMMKMSRRPKKCVSKQTWNSCRVKLSRADGGIIPKATKQQRKTTNRYEATTKTESYSYTCMNTDTKRTGFKTNKEPQNNYKVYLFIFIYC